MLLTAQQRGQGSPMPRLSLRPTEAAAACGVSLDTFTERIAPELRWVRLGRIRVVAVTELERWLNETAELVLEGVA